MIGLVESLLAPPSAAAPYPAHHDFWYQDLGAGTPAASGMQVSADTAMRVGAFWAAVNLRCKIVGSVPLHVYWRTGPGGLDRERATDHPLYPVLHDQPNGVQTSMQFRKHKEACRILRGNSFAYKVQDDRGDLLALLPLDPAYVTPEKIRVRTLPNGLPEYGLRYKVRLADGSNELILLSDEIHHTIGFSFDGLIGVSVVEYAARQTIGTSLAVQEYGGRFFGNGARPGGILAPKQNLSMDALNKLVAVWNQDAQGPSNAHRIKALPVDVTYTAVGLSNEDSQFLETQEHLVRECARLLEIPPHMIGETTKETSWGTGIEQMSIGFTVWSVAPWLEDDEQAMKRDLIVEDDIFAEHDLEGLRRGDSKARAEFFQTLRQNGVINAAQWARKENLPPPEGEAANVYWRPANMVDANAPIPAENPSADGIAGNEPPREPPRQSGALARYTLLLHDQAARVIRRELSAVRKIAERHAAGEGWAEAVEAFYAEHQEHVVQALRVPKAAVIHYCREQSAALTAGGVAACQDWETVRVADLVALALGDDAEAA